MKNARGFVLVVVTAPELKTARRLARLLCSARLAACVNLLNRVESHYWWQGNLEQGQEVLLLIKARARNLDRVEALLLKAHPYDTPEIIALPVARGTARYLAWWAAETADKG
jgi:periplasmic divalent cation tolerance protein